MSDPNLTHALATKTPYQVTFIGGRVGRCVDTLDLRALANGSDELAECIWRHIAPCVVSRECDIQVDLEHMNGFVFEGLSTIAKFTIKRGRRTAEGVTF